MELTPLSRVSPSAEVPLERLANSSRLNEKEKLTEACRQFEAVLLRQILQNGQKTHFKSTINRDSAAGEIYRDMVTHQLADSISKSRALGLADSLVSQLSQRYPGPEQNPS